MASYEQIGKQKLWSVRFREIGDDGREHNARLSGYRTKKEAERAYLERVHATEKRRAKAVDATNPVFSALVDEFLAFKDRRVKESSYVAMASIFKRHITPTFGQMTVREIRPADIEAWQAQKALLSPAYRETMRTYLGAILQYASDYYDIPNAIKKVPPLRDKKADVVREKPKVKHYEPDELSALLAAADEEPFRTIIWCIAYLGCRKGEALALTWKDISETDRAVHIRKTVTKKTRDKAYAITTPKSKASIRDIPVSDAFLQRMREYREWQEHEMPGEYVFAGSRPLPEKSLDNKFREAAVKAGVPVLSTKALRHTCVSILHSRGVDWIVISHRLGHSSVRITMEIYAHLLREDEDRSRDVMDTIM